jgi:hypothetical protein
MTWLIICSLSLDISFGKEHGTAESHQHELDLDVSVVEMELYGIHGHCRKQVEPEIGEIPVAFVAKAEGSELSEDDVKQFVAKEVLFLFLC